MTDDAFARMIALGERFEEGVRGVIESHAVPWHVVRLGCRVEYLFRSRRCSHRERSGGGPGRRARPADPPYLLNRGVLITPFHNMALLSPATSAEDVDRHTEVFGQARRRADGKGLARGSGARDAGAAVRVRHTGLRRHPIAWRPSGPRCSGLGGLSLWTRVGSSSSATGTTCRRCASSVWTSRRPPKNRLHLDFEVEDLDATTDRIVELGGSWPARRADTGGATVWRTMAGPRGQRVRHHHGGLTASCPVSARRTVA